MPGLYLSGMGGARAQVSSGYSSPPPPTASQAAFGSASTTPGNSSGVSSLLVPNDPTGVGIWLAVIAAVALITIRHSLPA